MWGVNTTLLLMQGSPNHNEVGVVQNQELLPVCLSYGDIVVIDPRVLRNDGVEERGDTSFFNTDFLVLEKSSTLDSYDDIFGMPGQSSVPVKLRVSKVCGGTKNINQGNVHAGGFCRRHAGS